MSCGIYNHFFEITYYGNASLSGAPDELIARLFNALIQDTEGIRDMFSDSTNMTIEDVKSTRDIICGLIKEADIAGMVDFSVASYHFGGPKMIFMKACIPAPPVDLEALRAMLSWGIFALFITVTCVPKFECEVEEFFPQL